MELNNIENYSLVDGYKDLIRDEDSNAIVNTNYSEFEQYVSIRSQKEKENLKIQSLESEVATIKGDLNEIKTLLRSLIKWTQIQ